MPNFLFDKLVRDSIVSQSLVGSELIPALLGKLYENFEVLNYVHHAAIKAPVAV